MTRTLLILRHAHRDTAVRSRDNGLSAKGRKQAARLRRRFREEFGKKAPAAWIASPSRRCIETMEAVARGSKRPVAREERLREKGLLESRTAFVRRWKEFVGKWRRSNEPLTVICGHGDGLPEAVRLLTGARVMMKKGAWARIERISGHDRLVELIQKP
jgi:broad specificity phosphatase PhoE